MSQSDSSGRDFGTGSPWLVKKHVDMCLITRCILSVLDVSIHPGIMISGYGRWEGGNSLDYFLGEDFLDPSYPLSPSRKMLMKRL